MEGESWQVVAEPQADLEVGVASREDLEHCLWDLEGCLRDLEECLWAKLIPEEAMVKQSPDLEELLADVLASKGKDFL